MRGDLQTLVSKELAEEGLFGFPRLVGIRDAGEGGGST